MSLSVLFVLSDLLVMYVLFKCLWLNPDPFDVAVDVSDIKVVMPKAKVRSGR